MLAMIRFIVPLNGERPWLPVTSFAQQNAVIRCTTWFYVFLMNFCLFEFYVMLKNFFWNMQLLHEAAHRNYFSNDSNQADLRVCLIQG